MGEERGGIFEDDKFWKIKIAKGHGGRFIAHRKLKDYLARVVYEHVINGINTIIVITYYISYIDRYFKGGIYEDKILSWGWCAYDESQSLFIAGKSNIYLNSLKQTTTGMIIENAGRLVRIIPWGIDLLKIWHTKY